MKIEIQEMTPNRGTLVFSDTDPSVINSIRRTMISDVPKMAIDTVEFHMGAIMDEQGKEYESVSPLFDEIIAHRLGMLPIPTNLDTFIFQEKCTCEGEGCPSCSIMYSINKKGPSIAFSGDLEPLGDASLKIKDDLIPIVKLKESQALLAYATAHLSTGRKHAKYSPACGVGMRYSADISIDSSKCDLDEACIESCPKDVFVREGKKIKVANPERCNLCNACIEVCELGCITIKEDPTRLVLKYETDGSLSAKELLIRSLMILEEKFKGFNEMVSSLEK